MPLERYEWMRIEDFQEILPTLEAEGINVDWSIIMNLTMAQSVDDLYTSKVGARRDYAVWRGLIRYRKDRSFHNLLQLVALAHTPIDILDG